MATISALMRGKQPGEIKLRREVWKQPTDYFTPYFIDDDGFWYGLHNANDRGVYADASYVDWEIYTEPQPKKIVQEWMLRDKEATAGWWVLNRLMTEEEIKRWADDHEYHEYRPTGRSFEI